MSSPWWVLARRLLIAALIAVLMAQTAIPAGDPSAAAAPSSGASEVIPLLGIFTGLRARNRVYREANAYIADRRAYYDGLRDQARQQLLNRQIGGLRRSQVSAYIKLVAAIEQERNVTFEVAEANKRGARAAFIARVEAAVINRVLGSGAGLRVLQALTRGVNSAQDFVNGALAQVSGEAGGILADVEKIRRVANNLGMVAGVIGGETGTRISNTMIRVANAINRPQSEIRAALQEVQGELIQLGNVVNQMNQTERTINVSQTTKNVAVNLATGGEINDPVVEAIVGLFARPGGDRRSIRDQARAQLLAGVIARCIARKAELHEAIAILRGAGVDEATIQRDIAACREIDREGLVGALPTATASQVAAEPTATETEAPSGIVTASGSFSESVPASFGHANSAFGTTFTITADFDTGAVSGSLIAGRSNDDTFDCHNPENPGVIYDYADLIHTDSYQTSFSGGLDPAAGAFSASIAPAGNTSFQMVVPYTHEACTHLNGQPPPRAGGWSGSGTISGVIGDDGSITLTTLWSLGEGNFSGSWEGSGSVNSP